MVDDNTGREKARDKQRDSEAQQRLFSNLSRRQMLQATALGVSVPSLPVGLAEADSDFVDILSIDPSDYPNILLNMSVDTPAGRNGDLTKGDFTVLEDGIEKEITDFGFGSSKSDIVFVFDDTGSMYDEIDALKSKVAGLVSDIEASGINSRYGLVTFKDDVETDLKLTDDASAFQSHVDALSATGGGDLPEDNFDAVVRGLDFEFRDDAQKILIDITDATSHYEGDGSGISEHTIEEVANRLTDSGVAYVAVSPGFSDEQAAKKVLAERVGGTYIDINEGDFSAILEELIRLIVTAYVVEYITDLVPGVTAPLSVIVEDPDRGTGRVDETINIPEDVVDADLSELISNKRSRIKSIRNTARPVLSADPAGGFPPVTLFGPDQLDREAERYLSQLDPDNDGEPELDGMDPEQVAEALERLINIESLTENAVAAPIHDSGSGSIIQRQIRAAFTITKTLAVEAISRGAGRAASRLVGRSVSDDIIRGSLDEASSIRKSLSSAGFGGSGWASRGLSQAAGDQRSISGALLRRYKDEVIARAQNPSEKFVEDGASGLVGGSVEPAAGFINELDAIGSGINDVAVQLEYQKYLNGTPAGNIVDLLNGLAELDPDPIDLSFIPDTVEVPVPGAKLGNNAADKVEDATNGFLGFIDNTTDKLDNVDELKGINFEKTSDVSLADIPEEITFDVLEELPDKIDLGDVPGVSEIQEIADLAAEVASIPETAPDPSIDQLVERLAEDAKNGSLTNQLQDNREAVLNTASSVIESLINFTQTALDGLKSLTEVVDRAESAVGVALVVAVLIGVIASGGTASIVAVAALTVLSTVLVLVSIAIDSLRYAVAQQARQTIGAAHSAGGGLITYTDLSLVGGGG